MFILHVIVTYQLRGPQGASVTHTFISRHAGVARRDFVTFAAAHSPVHNHPHVSHASHVQHLLGEGESRCFRFEAERQSSGLVCVVEQEFVTLNPRLYRVIRNFAEFSKSFPKNSTRLEFI